MDYCQLGCYRIPNSVWYRSRQNMNQVLRYADHVYPDAEKEYIDFLQKEEHMERYYSTELAQFKKKYKPGQPPNKISLSTPLYKAMLERRTSTVYADARYEFYYLFSLAEEYDRIIRSKPRVNLSSTVVYTKQSSVPISNHAATVHGTGGYPGVNTVSHGTSDAKRLQEENNRLQGLVEEQRDDIKRLREQNKENCSTIDELRTRLSGIASKQLTEGNPDFTDLSDKYRPTKVAEFLHSVYDDEWTNSLESLCKKGRLNEEEAIHVLMQLVKDIYKYCSGIVTEQKTQILMMLVTPGIVDPQKLAKVSVKIPVSPEIDRKIVDLQRDLWTNVIPNIQMSFKNVNSEFKKYKSQPEIEKYVDRCVELIWVMRITDPPMVLKWPEYGDQLDTNLYNPYQKKGTKVSFPVWPVTLLHEGGAVIYKGYAKPM